MLLALALLALAAPDWVAFPDEAPGLVTASPALGKAGRQFARAPVVATILDAAAALQRDASSAAADAGASATLAHTVVIADVGKKGGGKMPPHATHRDGRTVDILVPVVDTSAPDAGPGAPTPAQFPHGDDDGFGYCAKFDGEGRFAGSGWEGKRAVPHPSGKGPLCRENATPLPYAIDFGAIARLVGAIDGAGVAHGLRVSRVILAPEYVERVLATDDGKRIDARLAAAFVRRAVWTRHDDHVHIELEPRP